MKLNWRGQPTTKSLSALNQGTMFSLVLFWIALNALTLHFIAVQYVRGVYMYSDVNYRPLVYVNLSMYLMTVLIIMNTRRNLRRQCKIPEDFPAGDFLKTAACMP